MPLHDLESHHQEQPTFGGSAYFELPTLGTFSTPATEGDKLPFFCNICGKGFTQSGPRRRHIKAVHRMGRAIKCPMCDQYETFRKDTLRQHLHHGHRLGSMDTCPFCGLNHTNLVTHVLEMHKSDAV